MIPTPEDYFNTYVGFDPKPGSLADFMKSEFPDEMVALNALSISEMLGEPDLSRVGPERLPEMVLKGSLNKERDRGEWMRLLEKLEIALRSKGLQLTGVLGAERVAIPAKTFRSRLTTVSLTKNSLVHNKDLYLEILTGAIPNNSKIGRPSKVEIIKEWAKSSHTVDGEFIELHRNDNFRKLHKEFYAAGLSPDPKLPSLSTWKRAFDELCSELVGDLPK